MRRYSLVLVGLVACPVWAWGQTPDQRKETLGYLRALQQADGGFLPSRPDRDKARESKSSLRATNAALRALKYFGGEPADPAACARFVQSCFDKASGGFGDAPGMKPDVPTTAVGIMAVVELKQPVDGYRAGVVKFLGEHTKSFDDIRIAVAGLEAIGARPPQAEAWLAQIAAMRNPDGTYGKGDGTARETGSAVVAVLRLGGKVEHQEKVVQALKAGQRSDGAFGKAGTAGSDLETTYRVTRAFHMLKEKPANVEALRAFIAKCRNADGGYGIAPGQPSTTGATYYASIILHWLAEG
jgi:hypothetical protein